MTVSAILIIGFGYVGQRIARAERQRGNSAFALVRSAAGNERARSAGVAPVAGDLDQPGSLTALPAPLNTLYYLAPPPREGETDPRMLNLLAALSPAKRPQVFVYISTTGVYGDCKECWVNENSPTAPTQSRSVRRLSAERALLSWASANGTRAVILRVAGIYGPDRLPLTRIQSGEPMVDDPIHPSYVNVIHADDLTQSCLAAADRGEAGGIYNVCDGHPTTMMRYFQIVAAAAGLPCPPTISMAEARERMSPGMLSYVQESRRIDNKKVRDELGVRLQYPNVSLGVPACLAVAGDGHPQEDKTRP